ncbi:MAG: hypothetical protein BWY11_02460 [Firmicutes bacterium ADurb.Bin182]|nr:MAG: hypothetical protein BWY11_02460 [Firmicutes bacterium ADurb.Bin182]
MKKNLGIWFLLLAFCLFLLHGCAEQDYISEYEPLVLPEPISSIADAQYEVTESDATAEFIGPYGIKSLLDQKVYWDGETLQADFYFPTDVSIGDINGARSFVSTKLYLVSTDKYGSFPYEQWLHDNVLGQRKQKCEQVICNIYADDQLLMQDRYKEEDLPYFTHYENIQIILPARIIEPYYAESLMKLIRKNTPAAEFAIQKSLINKTHFLQVRTSYSVNPKLIEPWQKYIEQEVASLLIPEIPSNSNQPQMLMLQLFRNGTLYYQTIYSSDTNTWS